MCQNNCGDGYVQPECGCRRGGSGLAIVLVLFILLAILICPTLGSNRCC